MPCDLVLWFDSRSSACRRALELLREAGVEPELRRYLEEPPTHDELRELLARLGLPARAVLRRDEDEVQVLRLSEKTPEDELVEAMAAHPRILERPILIAGERAVVARPPERVLALLPPDAPADRAFALPIDGTLDLHTFAPADVPTLVPEWIGACAAAGLRDLRIVHGKGTGALRERVHALLGRDPRVASFRLAGEDGGGWGATLVTLLPHGL
jgi:arsenate reductase (glutaredoxin)